MGKLLAITLLAFSTSQAQQSDAQFEVAVIKKSTQLNPGMFPNECHGTDSRPDPRFSIPVGRCVFERALLDNLITRAYSVQMSPFASLGPRTFVTGGPDWMRSEMFYIEAKAADPSTATEKELYAMLRGLLTDRFKLKLSRAKKEVRGYALVVAKNGPRLSAARDKDARPKIQGFRQPSGLLMQKGENASMRGLAISLTNMGIGLVVDQTGLSGTYDFELTHDLDTGMAPKGRPVDPRAPSSSGPSLFTALEEQLGLRLVAQKISAEILVVESVEKPSDN